jgi:hypothetical protein
LHFFTTDNVFQNPPEENNPEESNVEKDGARKLPVQKGTNKTG